MFILGIIGALLAPKSVIVEETKRKQYYTLQHFADQDTVRTMRWFEFEVVYG
jgi:hypothetical protein